MKILWAFINFIKNKFKTKDNRRYVKDVKPGDRVQIEWKRFLDNIGYLTCINNDPQTKKILLEVKWGNYEEAKCSQTQRIILSYSSKELQNFNLLNPHIKSGEKITLEILEEQLAEAIMLENYERAEVIKKMIEKL